MKFGGTSVGTAERMKGVAKLVTRSGEPTFVVLSAMSGTTNSPVLLPDSSCKDNPKSPHESLLFLT